MKSAGYSNGFFPPMRFTSVSESLNAPSVTFWAYRSRLLNGIAAGGLAARFDASWNSDELTGEPRHSFE